jgi:peptidoglycan hydrolase-like protein with peptidoglycan-binding domain
MAPTPEGRRVAFNNFKYPDVIQQLGLTEAVVADLFAGTPAVEPGAALRVTLPVNQQLATTAHTEASRSTWLVGPVLGDFWARYQGRINVIAGADFQADPEAGLNGYCDFLIGRSPQLPYVKAPVVVIFEAKRDSIPDGLGQCVAGVVGAQRFNRRHNTPIDPVYGVVTTGSLWKFMQLSGPVVTIDLTEYSIAQVDKLLGILTHMVGPVPTPAAA